MSSPAHELLANHESIKTAGDIAAGFITFATIVSWLPQIAAALAIAWTIWRMVDRIKYGPTMSK